MASKFRYASDSESENEDGGTDIDSENEQVEPRAASAAQGRKQEASDESDEKEADFFSGGASRAPLKKAKGKSAKCALTRTKRTLTRRASTDVNAQRERAMGAVGVKFNVPAVLNAAICDYGRIGIPSKILTGLGLYRELDWLFAKVAGQFEHEKRAALQADLLFRASRDGFGKQAFDARCQRHKGATLFVIKSELGHVRGGFTLVQTLCVPDESAFLFLLRGTRRDVVPALFALQKSCSSTRGARGRCGKVALTRQPKQVRSSLSLSVGIPGITILEDRSCYTRYAVSGNLPRWFRISDLELFAISNSA